MGFQLTTRPNQIQKEICQKKKKNQYCQNISVYSPSLDDQSQTCIDLSSSTDKFPHGSNVKLGPVLPKSMNAAKQALLFKTLVLHVPGQLCGTSGGQAAMQFGLRQSETDL